jgi:hypothetical protein
VYRFARAETPRDLNLSLALVATGLSIFVEAGLNRENLPKTQ